MEKCTKCDLIIENETIRPKDSGKPFHAECFCCAECGKTLQGKYFTTEKGMLCEEDFAVSDYNPCQNCPKSRQHIWTIWC